MIFFGDISTCDSFKPSKVEQMRRQVLPVPGQKYEESWVQLELRPTAGLLTSPPVVGMQM